MAKIPVAIIAQNELLKVNFARAGEIKHEQQQYAEKERKKCMDYCEKTWGPALDNLNAQAHAIVAPLVPTDFGPYELVQQNGVVYAKKVTKGEDEDKNRELAAKLTSVIVGREVSADDMQVYKEEL